MDPFRKYMRILVPILAIIMVIGIVYSVQKDKKERKTYEAKYWEQVDVEFCGIVLSKKVIDHGFGLVCLELTYDNKETDYKLCINDDVFVCEIKGNKVTYLTEVVQLEIGDSICYNIKGNQSEQRFRNQKEFLTRSSPYIYKTKINYANKKLDCD